jgi:hypothetical protein
MTMAAERPTTGDIDLLQRASAPPQFDPLTALAVPPTVRMLVRIKGAGRADKMRRAQRTAARAIPESLVVGAHTTRLPLVAYIAGAGAEVRIYLGTWADEHDPAGLETLKTLVLGAYTAVEFDDVRADIAVPPRALDRGGIVLGFPSLRPMGDGSLPYDRLVRAMGHSQWAAVIIATPLEDSSTASIRNRITKELRLFERTAASADRPDPITRYYSELLDALLRNTGTGQAIGAWRTAVYLLGDSESYSRLAGLWRGIFASSRPTGEPFRVWTFPEALQLARDWAIPESLPIPPERKDRYGAPYQFQTVLTSAQLAAYFHLPEFETPGFSVKAEPGLDFDTEPTAAGAELGKVLTLGSVITGPARTGRAYQISVSSLTRHAFITGVTGSGKTVTSTNLVRGLDAAGIPFLVLEPTKSEYRRLSGDLRDPGDGQLPLGKRLRVFTLGDDRASPFRLNPFEPGATERDLGDRIPIAQHIDLLRSVFSAAFGMWTPLPQVLERCLYEIYTDRGWDFATGENRRRSGLLPPAAYPTLTDLSAKVDDVVSRLGYADEITSNIRAALKTRIDGLRTGGKGRMLDVQQSFPMEVLLNAPTVLELEAMGDDDDKAFLMGLLLVRLVEYRRDQAARGEIPEGALQHLLVIEEAHRLLTNAVASGDPEQANPRAKAVEAFTNLLSEIRAYGQGVAIIDQVPIRLAPDVIKNTDLKIAHRIVAGDDREVLGRTMAMDERQSRAVATLERGRAAVFHEGDDAPLLIAISPPVAIDRPADIEAQMSSVRRDLGLERRLRRSYACFEICTDLSICDEARRIIEGEDVRRTFARLALTLIESEESITNPSGAWSELRALVSSKISPTSPYDAVLRSVVVHASEWIASRRGAQSGWTFEMSDRYEAALRAVLLAAAADPSTADVTKFAVVAAELHRRRYDPFPRCARVCAQADPPVCLYRWAALDASSAVRERLRLADAGSSPPAWRDRVWTVASNVADQLAGGEAGAVGSDAARGVASPRGRAALCLVQLSFANDVNITPADVAARMDALLSQPASA